jgi:hypothetical protein
LINQVFYLNIIHEGTLLSLKKKRGTKLIIPLSEVVFLCNEAP